MSFPVKFAALGALYLLSSEAMAQQITVNIDEQLASQFGLDPDQLQSDMGAAMGDQLRINDLDGFMNGMANAAAISVKGLGVDYATNFKKYMIGGGLGTGVYGSGATFKRGDGALPEAGFSFQAALMAGLNLGMLNDEETFFDRVRIYGNGLLADNLSDDTFSGSFTNAGAHLQFKLIKSRQGPTGLVEWGGLDVTSGIEYTNYGLTLQEGFPVDTAAGDGTTIGWDATGSYEIDVVANTIPIELSTNLRIFTFNAFVGGAYDYNYGQASSSVELSGPLTLSNPNFGEEAVGSASVGLSGEGAASPTYGRLFGGIQIDVFMVHVYGQVNYGLNDSFGGHFGARLAR